jgi:transcriptional regulator with XRE-family HTH domain/predicted Fe-Mo cluster-binding NifX family protein
MDAATVDSASSKPNAPAEARVGRRLRELRTRRGFSLRGLADRSGLNVNTLSLVENGKSSPSVSTLQQLALALEVPIVTFFESEPVQKRIVYTLANERPQADFGSAKMQNLGKDLAGSAVQPFAVTLKPGTGSGEHMIVHTGHEFVYCLSGSIHYRIEDIDYILNTGDSLLFEAHLSHCWENNGDEPAQILLILTPSDEREEPGGRHFSIDNMKMEINMKIAVITDDGKTISQHFGRALHYLVLTVEDGKITQRELRDKLGHNHFSGGENHEHHGAGHGQDAASHNRHTGMAEAIADCQMLICGGMGMGAYQSMLQLKIKPVVTELGSIDEAVQAFIDGKLVDHTEMLH